MNIQIYFKKCNPDVLKAERFFKERRIPYQMVDLKKHHPGEKEIALFARGRDIKELVDRSTPKAMEKPIAHFTTESLILSGLLEDPTALVTPIVRNGNKVTIGVDESTWKTWCENTNG